MITTKSITEQKPQTQLDWCGNPMREGEPYGGRPEHMSKAQKIKELRGRIQPITTERREALKASMAHAREALRAKREALRVRREKRKALRAQRDAQSAENALAKEPQA